MQAAIDFAELR